MPLDDPLIHRCRNQFPALHRVIDGRRAIYLDGPAGTQVPQRVIDAIGVYLATCNANHGGCFATSRESDTVIATAHRAMADFFGVDDPGTVSFGPNMTTLTFALSRALSRTWQAGDEVLVSRLDHDANITPWVLAARDAGATVRFVEIDPADCTLDIDDLRGKLCDRTRLVAVGAASNSVGTINPIAEICRLAADAGALSFVDAVHFAPHRLIDIPAIGCDFLVCSAYKFFGPHVGAMWGRRELLERLTPYKLRPAPDDLPGRWMTGTQNFEGLAGVLAAVDYLADLGRELESRPSLPRRAGLAAAFAHIEKYERDLVEHLLDGLNELPGVRVWGIHDSARLDRRLPTVSVTHAAYRPQQLAEALDRAGIFVWHGNYYALHLTETLGLEPDGMVRLGLVHYNTRDEVDRLLAALRALAA